jgi:carboxypeptidase family protein/uncharacterized protein DUF3761
VSSLTATIENTSTSFIYRLSFQLRETSGRSAATLTGIGYTLSTGGTTDSNLSSPVRIAAGASVNVGPIIVTDSTGRGASTQVTVNVTFTDDNARAGSATASATPTPFNSPTPAPAIFTVSGTVTDATSRGVLPNISVELADNASTMRTTTTTAAGSYSFSNVAAGAYTVTASSTGYQSTSQSVTVSTASARVDFILPRTAPTPSPSPALMCNGATVPSVVDCLNNQGRLTPTAQCNDGLFSCSQTRSGTCSGHGGVRCYVCPGPLC